MANRKLKNEVLKHFKRVGMAYDKKALDDFFKDFSYCYHTDHLDLTKKKDKKDFEMLRLTIILAFEEHEHLIKRLNKVTQSVTQGDTQ